MDNQEQQTAQLFHSINRALRAWRAVASCGELSKAQFGTLLVIRRCAEEEGAPLPTLSGLAAQTGLSLPALSQRVRSLEELGCLERVPDPQDRRIQGIRLTEQGKDLLQQARRYFGGVMEQAMAHMGADSAESLITGLSRLADALEAVNGEGGEGR